MCDLKIRVYSNTYVYYIYHICKLHSFLRIQAKTEIMLTSWSCLMPLTPICSKILVNIHVLTSIIGNLTPPTCAELAVALAPRSVRLERSTLALGVTKLVPRAAKPTAPRATWASVTTVWVSGVWEVIRLYTLRRDNYIYILYLYLITWQCCINYFGSTGLGKKTRVVKSYVIIVFLGVNKFEPRSSLYDFW